VDLAEPGLAQPASCLERLDETRARRHTDQPIPEACGGLGTAGRAGGDVDGRRRLGTRVETRVVDGEVVAAVAVDLAAPEHANDLDRFFQHREPNLCRRPVRSDDVLVQSLAGAHTEEEAPGHEGRGRGLGDERRMDPHDGSRHASADPQALRRLGDRAEHGPDEGALPLALGPRVVMIRDHCRAETYLLSAGRVPNERAS
jgi:hypothetical protein